jgi:preprotein translocase subunit SecD
MLESQTSRPVAPVFPVANRPPGLFKVIKKFGGDSNNRLPFKGDTTTDELRAEIGRQLNLASFPPSPKFSNICKSVGATMLGVTIQGIEAGAAAFLAILVLAPTRTGPEGLLSAATAGAVGVLVALAVSH